MDLLNLDDLADIKRYVTIRKKKYLLADRSVGQMITAIKVAKAQPENEADEAQVFKSMVQMAQQIVPECPVDVIESLTARQIVALLQFANQDPNALAAEAATEARAKGKSGQVSSEKEVPVAGEA